jgi:hypothetical protein
MYIGYNYEICSQKWDSLENIFNCQHGTLRITIDKCMDIFDKDVHLYNNTGKIFINTTVQPFYIDNILKEYYIS